MVSRSTIGCLRTCVTEEVTWLPILASPQSKTREKTNDLFSQLQKNALEKENSAWYGDVLLLVFVQALEKI